MSKAGEAQDVIKALEGGSVYAQCPCCEEPIKLKSAGLFYMDDFTPEAEKLYQARQAELRERATELKERRKAIPTTSQVGAKSVNLGLILERLAPALKTFNFSRNDCRSIFDPIDYLIFEGLSLRGLVSKIFFADIKTGTARLKPKQREIKTLVEKKAVDFDSYTPEKEA